MLFKTIRVSNFIDFCTAVNNMDKILDHYSEREIAGLIAEINEVDDLKLILHHHPCLIRYFDEPSFELQVFAVRENFLAINFIPDPNDELMIEAVKQEPFIVLCFKGVSDKVLREAARREPELRSRLSGD